MNKQCKVVMLPTEKASEFIVPTRGVGKGVIHLKEHYGSAQLEMGDQYHEIYITSDEDIKKGDWIMSYDIEGKFLGVQTLEYFQNKYDKKIIATTDESLRIDSTIRESDGKSMNYGKVLSIIGRPSQSFIQAYVKAYNEGSPIINVMVECYSENLIDEETGNVIEKGDLKLSKEGNIIIHQDRTYSREEVIAFSSWKYSDDERELWDTGYALDKWNKENL